MENNLSSDSLVLKHLQGLQASASYTLLRQYTVIIDKTVEISSLRRAPDVPAAGDLAYSWCWHAGQTAARSAKYVGENCVIYNCDVLDLFGPPLRAAAGVAGNENNIIAAINQLWSAAAAV